MPELLLGPLLRYAGETDATVWVETDAACEVEVLGGRSRTFHVEGHHYALVHVAGLEPGDAYEYEVLLDGERRWPEAGSPFPPSMICTLADGESLKLVFGSCRISAPHEPPYTSSSEEDERGLGVDALYAMAMRLRDEPVESLPRGLVLLGDQIYSHKPPLDTLDFIRSRRDTGKPPGEEAASFEEYAHLYRDSWGDPAIRWLLSTVPSAMIFDDHEVADDWNISEAWVEETRNHPWWNDQISGSHVSYWIYQHLGNLSPKELAENDLFERVKTAEDAGPVLREYAYRAHRESAGTRWSFYRDFGGARLVMIDSRGGRVLERGQRSMVDAEEWRWIEEYAIGGFDHLLLGTSLPVLLGPGMHHLQAWNEAVCSGVWGERAAEWGEKIRRSQDLDHWSSFRDSFVRLTDLIRRVGAGEKGRPPASILVFSGDVHHGYLTESTFRDDEVESPVYQVVCSPLRNSLPGDKSRLQRLAWTKPGELAGRALSRLAGLSDPEIRWSLTHGSLWFENQIASLELNGRQATLVFEKAVLGGSGEPGLEKIYEYHLV
ncbi:MAG: alkaline phosphatase family protein [Actinomycetota bacterium]|nr:alkaline phosphatase family protein [Actinomycetota bacterium]